MCEVGVEQPQPLGGLCTKMEEAASFRRTATGGAPGTHFPEASVHRFRSPGGRPSRAVPGIAALGPRNDNRFRAKPRQRAVRNARPKSPCCLPQTRRSPPCCPSVASGIELFDLLGIIGGRSGDFRRRLGFSPCSEGGTGPPSAISLS